MKRSTRGKNIAKPSKAKYILIGILIFFCAIAVSGFVQWILQWKVWNLESNTASIIVGLIQDVVASVSVCLVLYQLEKGEREERIQRNISEAQFILQYNRAFMENEHMAEVEKDLEDFTYYNTKGDMINSNNRQYFVNYLVYFEGLASSVLRDELSLEHIDDLMAYRFFLVVNNVEVQEKQLFEFADYYRGCFALYKKWKQYRMDHKKPIPLLQNSLDQWEEFEKYVN